MIPWRLKTQTVEYRSTCLPGWTMKHNGQYAISFLPPEPLARPAGTVRLQNQNNKKDMLCVTR